MKSCTNNFGGTKLSGEVSLGVRAEKRLTTIGLRDEHKLRIFAGDKYLDLSGRKWRETGEDCIMMSFIT
jgi:hypothetical protein